MSRLVTFIKKPTDGKKGMDGYATPRPLSIKELVKTKRNLGASTAFFQVPESHAEQVLRKNPGYQEVDYDHITALAAKPRRVRRKAAAEVTSVG